MCHHAQECARIRETVKTVSPRSTPNDTRLKPGANETLTPLVRPCNRTGLEPGANERRRSVELVGNTRRLNPRANATALLRVVLFNFCLIAQAFTHNQVA